MIRKFKIGDRVCLDTAVIKPHFHPHWYYSGVITEPYYAWSVYHAKDDLVALDWYVPDSDSFTGYKVNPTTWSESDLVLATDEEIALRLLLLLSRKS